MEGDVGLFVGGVEGDGLWLCVSFVFGGGKGNGEGRVAVEAEAEVGVRRY